MRAHVRLKRRLRLHASALARLTCDRKLRANTAGTLFHTAQAEAACLLRRIEASSLILHGNDDVLRLVLDREHNLPRIGVPHRIHNCFPADMEERIGDANRNV